MIAALMWICFFTVALVPIPTDAVFGQSLVLLGAFAPSLAVLLVTARTEGGRGVGTLLRGVIKWRVAARWYFFAASFAGDCQTDRYRPISSGCWCLAAL